jgi:hypothetical protein
MIDYFLDHLTVGFREPSVKCENDEMSAWKKCSWPYDKPKHCIIKAEFSGVKNFHVVLA